MVRNGGTALINKNKIELQPNLRFVIKYIAFTIMLFGW